MDYSTQMEAARKGIVTEALRAVAGKEGMPVEKLMSLVAAGQAIIPFNKNHTCLVPNGIGSIMGCATRPRSIGWR